MLTLEELCERIAEQTDEITVLEILDIDSYQLVDRFKDKIEEKFEQLIKEYDD